MRDAPRFCFGQDGDCHWYLIPIEALAAFHAWRDDWEAWDSDERDIEDMPDSAPPAPIERLGGGPESWTFADPKEDRHVRVSE